MFGFEFSNWPSFLSSDFIKAFFYVDVITVVLRLKGSENLKQMETTDNYSHLSKLVTVFGNKFELICSKNPGTCVTDQRARCV